MRIAYLDPVSGVSGDMLLGALVGLNAHGYWRLKSLFGWLNTL